MNVFLELAERDFDFRDYVRPGDVITYNEGKLMLGRLFIDATSCRAYAPIPTNQTAWTRIPKRVLDRLNQLLPQDSHNAFSPGLLELPLLPWTGSKPVATEFAGQLVQNLLGLGVGLTPSGDDFLIGVLLAASNNKMLEAAAKALKAEIGKGIAKTTRISAAMFTSALAGDFHEFYLAVMAALAAQNPSCLAESVGRALAIGATSGRDALAGLAYVVNGIPEKPLEARR